MSDNPNIVFTVKHKRKYAESFTTKDGYILTPYIEPYIEIKIINNDKLPVAVVTNTLS